MSDDKTFNGSILRVFEARAKQGCADTLAKKLATTSVDVVRNQPGNQGHFFGKSISDENDVFVFVSVWKDLVSIKKFFGEKWENSFLPPGYSELIEECSIRHVVLGRDWLSHVPEASSNPTTA
jgi:quinol monooxygenase YgiN